MAAITKKEFRDLIMKFALAEDALHNAEKHEAECKTKFELSCVAIREAANKIIDCPDAYLDNISIRGLVQIVMKVMK